MIEVDNKPEWDALTADAPAALQAVADLEDEPQGLQWYAGGTLRKKFRKWAKSKKTTYAPREIYALYEYPRKAGWNKVLATYLSSSGGSDGAIKMQYDLQNILDLAMLTDEELSPYQGVIDKINAVADAEAATQRYAWIGGAILAIETYARNSRLKDAETYLQDLVTSGRGGPPQKNANP